MARFSKPLNPHCHNRHHKIRKTRIAHWAYVAKLFSSGGSWPGFRHPNSPAINRPLVGSLGNFCSSRGTRVLYLQSTSASPIVGVMTTTSVGVSCLGNWKTTQSSVETRASCGTHRCKVCGIDNERQMPSCTPEVSDNPSWGKQLLPDSRADVTRRNQRPSFGVSQRKRVTSPTRVNGSGTSNADIEHTRDIAVFAHGHFHIRRRHPLNQPSSWTRLGGNSWMLILFGRFFEGNLLE